jgi:hypothetical protein
MKAETDPITDDEWLIRLVWEDRVTTRVWVQVWADWPDYGPVRDGLPVMHYRLQIRRPGSNLSRDERMATPAESERVIWQAFGWA